MLWRHTAKQHKTQSIKQQWNTHWFETTIGRSRQIIRTIWRGRLINVRARNWNSRMRWSAAHAWFIHRDYMAMKRVSEGEYRPFQQHSLGNVPFVTSKIFRWSAALRARARDRAQPLLFMCVFFVVSAAVMLANSLSACSTQITSC